jgi:hypothetical protein
MALKLGTFLLSKKRPIPTLCANFYKCLSSQAPTSERNKSRLEDDLIKRIKMRGPLTVAEFMKEALGNPIHVSEFLYLILIIIQAFLNFTFKIKGILHEKRCFWKQR